MKPTTIELLRPQQMVDYVEEKRQLEEKSKSPYIHDRNEVHRQLRSLEASYTKQAPEPLTGDEKDKLAKRADALLSTITQGMLTQDEMRRNPVGAVDRHMKWERANKKRITEWKNIQLQLQADFSHPETWDRDAANLERHRPVKGTAQGVRVNAQIEGLQSFGDIPDEQWEGAGLSLETPNSALNQARRVDAERKKKPMSGEQRAKLMQRLELARRRRAEKRAAAAESAPAYPTV